MNYLIIGNSIAAVGCIEGIRKTTKDGKITVVGAEPYHVYGRPLISYLLEGKTDLERMKYRPDDFYEKNGCELKKGISAVRINGREKSVLLESGEILSYDKLLIATGARPFVPRIPGLEKYEYFTFMTLDDAKGLQKKLDVTPNAKVLILGAGLIGLKCAEAVYEKASEITVVDMADRVLPSVLDGESSVIIKERLEAKGIRFTLSAAAELDALSFDILCVCTGVIPETSLAKEAGLEVGRGIFIDENSKTSHEDIYAAGDCTESYSAVTGKRGAVPILPNAYLQGENAGINMAGGRAVFDKAMPVNALGFFGTHILTAGTYEGEPLRDLTGQGFKKLFLQNGFLKGFIIIDDFKRAGLYTAAVRDAVDLSSMDSHSVFRDMGLRIYSKEKRDEILRKK